MPILTKNQVRAQRAYTCIQFEVNMRDPKFATLAKTFPALVHTCGLAQAVAFAAAKNPETGARYLGYLTRVMPLTGDGNLQQQSREVGLLQYQQLTRDVMESATWLKRYTETLIRED